MTTAQLIRQLQLRDVQLSLLDGKLKLNAPPGVLDAPTLELLRARKAELIELLQSIQIDQSDLPVLQPTARMALMPCAPAQQRLWLVQQAGGHGAAYNLPAALRLRGTLDIDALTVALRSILRRHEALRTGFAVRDGEPMQTVLAADDPRLQLVLDVIVVSESEIDAQFDAHAARKFDLAAAPLFDARLLRVAQDDHVLLVNMHHIVSDGWSMGVLVSELCEGYRAVREQRAAVLPELSVHYVDYAAWQRELASTGALAKQCDYWRQRLAGISGLLALPTDHPRPPLQSQRGATLDVRIPAVLVSRLRQLAQDERATLFMLLLAAFQVQLSRLVNEQDIVVGSPIANRVSPQLEPLIGFFVNTVVLRTTVLATYSFRQLLRNVREQTLRDFAHQELPFEQLVELLKPSRSLSHSPLFQVAFTLESGKARAIELPGLRVESLSRPGRFAKFDLTLALEESADDICGAFEYATDLFEPVTVRGWSEDFLALLNDICDAPDRMLALLGSDNEQEVAARIAIGIAATTEAGTDRPWIPALLARHARERPQALALSDGLTRLSFADLEQAATRLAHRLRALGLMHEARVGVCLPRGPRAVVAMLAVWKADAAWVPLDPSYPLARLQHISQDAGLACVIGGAETISICADLGKALLHIDENEDAAVAAAPSIESPATNEQLAYLIYTSGSTGTPKGAMVTHRSLRLLADWYATQTALMPGARHSQMAQFGFDAMVIEIWCALAAGASLHFVDAETRLHPRQLAAWLEAEGIHVAFMPTPLAEEFLASGAAMPKALQWISCGGDRLKHHALAGGPRVLNCYGLTETTVISTAAEVPEHDGAPITIGRPLPNTRAYVLDGELRPVAIGQAGELYVAGAMVGRGYHGKPGMTAARFMPDPYADTPGARMYRTGDRVRWLPCGQIEFLGRVDTQVKLRGFRIEIGEIETVLAQQPDVGDAAVALLTSPSGAPTLVGYLTAAEAHRLDLAALRSALTARLPSYMVPALLQVVPALPLLPSGKVNRSALPSPQWGDTEIARVEPRSAEEAALHKEWCALLGIERIGVDEDFFALGGHSLLATRLLARVHARFDVSLGLAALFESPTIARLAERIVAALQAQAQDSARRIVRVDRSQPLPLSFAQQRLWFLAQLDPDSDAYHMPTVLRLRGRLDVAAMRAAVADLVARHEVLRARFLDVDGEPRQHFDRWPAALQLHAVQRDQLDAALHRFMAQRFDLDRDPVLRASLFEIDEHEHVLALVVHHIVADGWSMHLISKELATCYAARCAGNAPALPVPELHYGDYAHWQRQLLDDAVLDRSLQYWTRQLSGTPAALDLPRDGVRRAGSASTSLRLDPLLVAELRQFAQARGATLFMGLLAVLKALLMRLSGQGDVCIGTPIANRDRIELESMVGLFLGTLALRTQLADACDFEEALRRVRDTVVSAYLHQQVPFERIVDALKLDRDRDRHPLFQVFFNLIEHGQAAEPVLPGLEVVSLMPPEQDSKFDFTLYAHTRGDDIDLQLHYDSALFSTARMVAMLQQFQALLREMLRAPAAPLLQHSLRTDADRGVLPDPQQPLANEWQGAITSWFARCCAQHPNRIAVCDAELSLSFAALDQASNRVAQCLLAQGVATGDVVALHSSRCSAVAVGLLGVLKAGAAFMMLDAAYPDERLEACIDIAGPKAWLHVGAHRASTQLARTLDQRVPRQLRLDPALTGLQHWPAHAPPLPTIHAHSLSHIAFTSGSSGRPKAIAGRHGPFTQFLDWFRREFDIGAGDRYSVLSGLAHDPMQRDVLWPLMLGGTACFPDPELMIPGALVQWMRAERISVANLTPAMSRVLTEDPLGTGLPDLRRAFVVGDVLTRDVVEKLVKVAPDCRVHSFYGATETQWALAWERGDAADASEVVALGRGFPGVQLLLRNEAGTVAGVGELAEICIRSPHLSGGYWRDEAMTAERFIANPSGTDPNDRLYRTGDLGRYLPDGRVRGLGRSDRQVSVRGFRVELGEIEAVLARHADVRQVAVIDRRNLDVGGDQSALIAFVVVRSELDWQRLQDELRQRLRAALPEYMQPTRIECLEAMPLNANGKVDQAALHRRALPQIATTAGLPPQGPTEIAVAQVFADILGRAAANREDHFFELGGNSLMAMRLVARLRAGLDRMVPVRLVFEQPTIAGLAAALENLAHRGPLRTPMLMPRDRSAPAPLSFAQQRLWFLHQLDGGGHTYNMLLALRLSGELRQEALAAALAKIVDRHEILRTLFVSVDGAARQQVLPAGTGLVFDAVPCEERELAAAVDAFSTRSFTLDREPAMRARVFRLAPDLHVLAISMHHIISDGWSMAVFARELGEAYQAACFGRDPDWTPLALQFADYADWQRRHLQGDALEADRAFWRAHLAGLPPLLELPLDHPRPAQQSHRGEKVPVCIDGRLHADLLALCGETGTTPFMLLMAAWQLLLARLAGVNDLAVGFPVAGRGDKVLEPLIGLFANTLVLRTHPEPMLRFRDYLAEVRSRCLAVFAHQDLPFEAMVELLQPQRSLAHTPLFQVMFNLQNLNESSTAQVIDGLTLEPFARGTEAARFDLTLVLSEHADRWSGDLEYCVDLFDRDRIASLVERFTGLLAAIVATPDALLARLPVLTAAERVRLAHAGNGSERSERKAVHQSVEDWARIAATREAVVMAGQGMDYATLNSRANRLAHWLRAHGIGTERLVALMLPRSPAGIVATLAVLKSGAAFLPIDPETPPQRLRQILDDATPAMLLVQDVLPEGCTTGTEVIVLDKVLAGLLESMPDSNPDLPVHGQQLAYAIYTSGSTGTPKAALLEHRGWSNLAAAQAGMHDVDGGARVLQLVSPAFDVAAGDFALALSQGATLVLAPDEARRNPELLQQVLRDARISHVQMPVALLAGLSLEPLPDLRVMIAGGEAMPVAVVEQWAARVALHNAYGPTEATVMATCARMRQGQPISIGSAIAGVRIHVLDAQLQPVADGVRGEIWIAGEGLGRGYLQRPSLTAAVFLPDPFAATPGQRMYRTGDLGRWRRDGCLEILGRIDDQVKLRGYRIELGEIEAVLRRCAGVEDAAVCVQAVDDATRRLVAYLSCKDEQALPAIRVEAEARLMSYMQPAVWVVLRELPKTANGKLDRRALPAPDDGALRMVECAVAHTPAERALHDVWCRLLGRKRIDVNESFFDLGGDSILSIRAIALLAEAGWKVSTRQMYEHQCISRLARVARAIGLGDAVVPVSGEMPLTPIQHWFFDTVNVARERWNQSVLVTPQAGLSFELMENALVALQQHHAALRLRVLDVGGQRRAWLPDGDQRVPLERVDLDADNELAFAQLLAAQAERIQGEFVFDGRALFRAVWFESTRSGQRRLWLLAHHLLIDAVSWRIVLADLRSLLQQLMRGAPAALPMPGESLPAWSRKLQTHAGSAEVRGSLDYWCESLAMAVPELGGREDAADLDADADKITVELGAEETRQLLEQSSRAYATGINDLLLTAVALAFSRWRGGRGIRLALEGHGRELPFEDVDLSRTVGWFTASYPLSLHLPEDEDLGARILAIKAQLQRVPHAGLSYGLLRYLAREPRLCALAEQVGEAPISFNYLGQFDEHGADADAVFALASEYTGRSRDPGQRRPHAIDLIGLISDGRLLMDFRYGRERFDHESLRQFAQAFLGVLRDIIAHCRARSVGMVQHGIRHIDPARAADLVLVPMQTRGQGPALFCVHPAGGSVDCYRALAAALADTLPVYGLQAASLDGTGPLLNTFPRMAALYVDAIRHQQPRGPYRLLGWSQGGTIAYEMACQLQGLGETVEVLFLVDSGQSKQMLRTRDHRDEADELLEYLQEQGFVSAQDDGATTTATRFDALVRQAHQQGLLPAGMAAAQVRAILATQRAIAEATAAHEASVYRGRVVLLRAEDDHLFGHLGERLGWAPELCADWQRVDVPGDHFSCVQSPQVQVTAERVRRLLKGELWSTRGLRPLTLDVTA